MKTKKAAPKKVTKKKATKKKQAKRKSTKRKKNPGGRPSTIDDIVIAKLEQAFMIGCTDLEACLYAGIKKDAFYRYIQKNPEFGDRKEVLKQSPFLQARKTIIKALGEDAALALKYMERKKKDEFSLRTEHNIDGGLKLDASLKAEADKDLMALLEGLLNDG